MIRQVLLTLNVDDFSEMKGKHIWVIGEGDGFSFKPKGIEALYVDNNKSKELIFDEVYDKLNKEHNWRKELAKKMTGIESNISPRAMMEDILDKYESELNK